MDEIQVLSSRTKVLYFPDSSQKSPNDSDPRTPERQTNSFEKETKISESDNIGQPNNDVSAQTTNCSVSSAVASPRTSKLFKKPSTEKRILWAT